ncbi:MAG: SUMF1/EgtB/PvdO family nonheme iron enzyme [Candidatus Marinimicrobia bacterium]|nr:SUMF1/EgtB/PvdO family nonheme iron enzyme [Candidatus Neomarinimicrobiota bacterium]
MNQKLTTVIKILLFLVHSIMHTGLVASPKIWINPMDGMRFVWVEPGSVWVQSEPSKDFIEGANLRVLEMKYGFWMAETEVTIGQYRKFVQATSYITDAEVNDSEYNWKNPGFDQSENHPAVYLSFRDAQSYAKWARVNLPTESEWVFALRAGTNSLYPWEDEPILNNAWLRENSPYGTHEVALKPPNFSGVFDLVGNAYEYCIFEPKDSSNCNVQSVPRGGSWTRCSESVWFDLPSPPTDCFPWNYALPYDDDRGFRCVKRLN